MRRLKVERYRAVRFGHRFTSWRIAERDGFLGFNTIWINGMVYSYDTKAEAEEFIRLYRAVCKNWKSISRNG